MKKNACGHNVIARALKGIVLAGAFAATANSTIHPDMSVENINILMKKEDI